MNPRIVEVREGVLRKNDVLARELRERFHREGVLVVSLVSSPGAGKTALLEKTLASLRGRKRVAALWQDSRDAASDDTDPGFEQSPRVWAELGEEMRSTFVAISELSATLRITLVLATVQGMAYKSIAELLGIPEGTVAWRVNEARRQLKAKLAHVADEK